ncbi:MAG: AAA family ATPase, partial [Methylococcaceae bacterium]
MTAIQETGNKLYLFMDEYDNFANEILVAKQEQYESLIYGDGLFRTLFKAVKAATSQGLDRVFITGVSPVAMSDITSGYNVAKNIYLKPRFNTLCGFTGNEVSDILQTLSAGQTAWSVQEALGMMRTFYNGYRFCEQESETVYNPTLCLYFMEALQEQNNYPEEMLDDNLGMDRNRLIYLAGLLEGEPLLIEALGEGEGLIIPRISRRFGVADMLKKVRDRDTVISLFYYFGILTLAGRLGLGKWVMKIPNLVSRSLYVDQLRDLYVTASDDRNALNGIKATLFEKGDIKPACEFVENRLLPVLSNRDYRWINELAIKVMFMTVLYDDLIYMMVSETEVNHGYADLSFIVRPDARQYKPLDLVIEFKYLSLKDLGMSGEVIRDKSSEELMKLPLVSAKLAEAENQAIKYGDTLKDRYHLDTITRFAVVAIGLERVVYK